MKSPRKYFLPWICAAGLLAGCGAWADQPAPAASPKPHQRFWKLSGSTWVRLVPREAGASANDQPMALDASALGSQLASIEFKGPIGYGPLFTRDEVARLTPPLREAMAAAGPDEDLLLVSTNRRDGENILVLPRAVTMRLFWRENALQVIVRDARFEFLASDVPPQFTFGSRGVPGTVQVRAAGAASQRGDWLIFQRPATETVTVLAPAAPIAATPVAAPARNAAFFQQQEQRLRALKHLREEGLVTEDEYQKKRLEILNEM